MGVFYIDVEVVNIRRPGSKAAVHKLLVDSGSEYTWIPEAMLKRAKIQIVKKDLLFLIAKGKGNSMFGDGPLTFREFMRRERLPLARVHDAVLDFLRGRGDCVLCGAHVVNAYVNTPRLSQDVDILSNSAAELAQGLRKFLKYKFKMKLKIDVRQAGLRFCLCQVR